ncbi:DUF4411 family protein [bacterium]|nr:DUF4411 family protein [bacterium]
MENIYVIDTSSLARLRPSNDSGDYDLIIFPGIMEALEILINEKRLFSSQLVYHELEKYSSQGDELLAWATDNRNIFLPPTETIQRNAKNLLSTFPNWIDVEKNKNDADPFVVATAMELDAIVVSEEKEILMQPNTKKIKIPNVCSHVEIKSNRILNVFRNEDFRFVMRK